MLEQPPIDPIETADWGWKGDRLLAARGAQKRCTSPALENVAISGTATDRHYRDRGL